MEKNQLRTGSHFTTNTSQSLYPVLPIEYGFAWVKYMDRHLKASPPIGFYDMEGNEVDDEPRMFVDSFDWESENMHCILQNVKVIIDHDTVEEHNPSYPDETYKALNAHIVTGLSANADLLDHTSNVLVVCVDDAEDVNRIAHCNVDHAKTIDLVGCNTINARATENIALGGPEVRTTPLWLQDLPDGFLRDTYDLMVCHHGLHQLLSTPEGEVAFIKLLHRLSPRGRLIGDKIDYAGFNSAHMPSYMPSRSVELLQYDPRAGLEGEMRVRVRDKIWLDPVLSNFRLESLVSKAGPGFVVNIHSGFGAWKARSLSGLSLNPPSRVRNAANSGSARVVTYVEIGRVPPFGPVFPLQDWTPTESRWSIRERLPDYLVAPFAFGINKGQPLQPKDVHYMYDNNIMYSEKLNGVSGRCLIIEGTAWLLTSHIPPRIYHGGAIHYTNLPTLRIQVEVFDNPFRVVVVEPVSGGYSMPNGFRGRLSYTQGLLSSCPQAQGLLDFKTWYSSWQDVSDKAKSMGWEGVVMMTSNCPPPSPTFTRGARYVKFQYTYDVLLDGRIWEVRQDGSRVRRRDDKDVPNNPEAIRWARDAVDFDAFDKFMEIDCVSGKSDSILSRPPSEYTYEECCFLLKYPFATIQESNKPNRKRFIDYITRTELWQNAIRRCVSVVDSKEIDDHPIPFDGLDDIRL